MVQKSLFVQMGFLPPFRKNIPKNIKKKMPTQRKRELFFRRFASSRPREDACVSFRFTPSREGCARWTTRPLDETARYFHAKDPRGSMETRPRAFSDGIRPSECVCDAFLFRFKKCNSANTSKKSTIDHTNARVDSLSQTSFSSRVQKNTRRN